MTSLVTRARNLGALVLLPLLHPAVAAAADPRDRPWPDEDAPPPLRHFGLMFDVGSISYNARLAHFDYDFASLHPGWEKESAGVLFFVQGGASVLWTELPALDNTGPGSARASGTLNGSEPYWLVLPSLRLGFVGFL